MEHTQPFLQSKGYKIALLVTSCLSCLAIVALVIGVALMPAEGTDTEPSSTDVWAIMSQDSCNVLGIPVTGDIITTGREYDENGELASTSSFDVVSMIEQANHHPDVAAIVMRVDSYGGSPVAAEEIANAIALSEKPVIGWVRQAATSGGYWSISSADRIFASANSDVGSIGVTASYLDTVESDKKEGYHFVSLASGKFKDTGTPSKPLSPEERNIIMRDVLITHNNFIDTVAKNRKLDRTAVANIADGSTMMGAAARDMGLIDEIGGISEIQQYLREQVSVEPVVCW